MDLDLKNKTALVTGSTSGIGFAIAKLLAKEGAEVVLNGRSAENIEKAKRQILEEIPNAQLKGFVAEFSKKEAAKEITSQLKSIDILINNVGIYSSQSFEETPDDDWYNLFEVNVMSGVRLSRHYLPIMKQKGWGRIIFVSSECAHLVPEDLIAYSMTKTALLSISRGLAQTTVGTSVTVNSVLPGSTLSEGAENFLKTQAEKYQISEKEVANNFFKNVRTSSLIQRFITVGEIAQTVVYLSSPLSAATNGASIKLDGGSIGGIF